MTNEEFYAECAALLNTEHTGKAFPYRKRTRWNNRTPGRGRFEGYGIIRAFGDHVQMCIYHPVNIIRNFDSKCSAIDFLKERLYAAI